MISKLNVEIFLVLLENENDEDVQTCEWKRIKQPQAEARPNEKSNLLHSDGR